MTISEGVRRDHADERLQGGQLGTTSVVFMVLAASAPLAVVVALMPIAFAYGNGAGLPGAYFIAVMAMILFAIGYVRIIPFVKNAGAFYAYIAAGFGKEIGLAAAFMSATAYFALCGSTLAALAFFCADLFKTMTGMDTHWAVWGILSTLLIFFVSTRKITSAAIVLTLVLLTEIVVIVALDIAVWVRLGPPAFNLSDFSIQSVFAPGLGIALIYAFNGLAGIEGTAIYQEEAKDRTRTTKRATFIALLLAGVFYILTAWSLASAVGSGHVAAIAGADPGHFVFAQANDYLGAWSGTMFSILVITSAFAASLGLFNNASRYVFALARDRVLPATFAKTHPVNHSPRNAAVLLGSILLVVIVLSAVSGLDPLLNVSPALIGIGSISLMLLIVLTSFAIAVFFARRGEISIAKTAAPVAGGIVVGIASWMAITNYSALTGIDSPVVNSLIWVVPATALIGFCLAVYLRAAKPETYGNIGASRVEAA